VVIGADGFGIAQDESGAWVKIPQIGAVRIGDDVEIGANTTIDRGALDDTVIENGVKLDNQIQIGHNCRIGAHTAMAGCVAVAGSANIGRHCTIGAASVILGHLKLADRVNVSAGTVISRSIHQPGTYTGMYPFDDNESWAKNTALVRHLAELADRVRALEKNTKQKEKKNG
jgi:UDP-3-O-[3-hydroxymyristoyl] glucosamine N-acyltransferase